MSQRPLSLFVCDRCGSLYACDAADAERENMLETNPCLVCSRGKGYLEYAGLIEPFWDLYRGDDWGDE